MARYYQYQAFTQPIAEVVPEVITPDRWLPYGPTQYRLRYPRRDVTSDVRISGFEATSISQWQSLPWRQYRLRRPNRNNTSHLIRAFLVDSTPVDQWNPYGPIQYRLRYPQRDNTADVRISGFEAIDLC